MENIKLSDGNEIPQIGLGTWQLTGESCKNAVLNALKSGYTHIDTAWIYGNHTEVGDAIKESGINRSELFITSKFGIRGRYEEGLSYERIMYDIDETLEQLQLEYLDLYLLHWPNREIPFKDTFRALVEIVKAKKVKSIGVCNCTINHIKDILSLNLEVPIVMNQVEFHPKLYQSELKEFCESNGIKVTAYSPLGSGNLLEDSTLKEIGEKYNKSIAQICIRWCIQKGLVVIPRSTNENRIKSNLEVLDFEISDEDLKIIDSLNEDKRFVSPPWNDFNY